MGVHSGCGVEVDGDLCSYGGFVWLSNGPTEKAGGMTEDEFKAWLHRQGKPATKAREERYYGDPARHVKFDRERGRGMQRDIDEVEVLLDMWAEWMKKPDSIADWYPNEAAGVIASAGNDSESLYEAEHNERMERVDAAFDSIAPIYREAIRRKYGLGSRVFRFAKDVTFEDAKIMMRVKLVLKGLL